MPSSLRNLKTEGDDDESIDLKDIPQGGNLSPSLKAKYWNEEIELELKMFKKEIEEKFAKSKVNLFKFPRVLEKNPF